MKQECGNLLSVILFCLIFLTGCGKEEIKKTDPTDQNPENTWIYNTLDKHYLWDIPEKSSVNMNDSAEDFFDSLLSDEDGVKLENGTFLVFSYLEEKLKNTKAASEKVPTYGLEYVIYQTNGNNGLFARVLYVLPDSPAAQAGIERGDWICNVDNPTGYFKNQATLMDLLDSGNGGSFYMGKVGDDDQQEYVIPSGEVKEMPAASLVKDIPILKDSVLNIGGKKIAYLMYNRFASGPDDTSDDSYDRQLKEVFRTFKTAGVTDFVLDMRYNGGGLLSCAQLLSSMLAPADALGKDFCKLTYNKKNESNNRTLKFETKENMNNYNLNLQKLYVLTGQYTASSSEAVINCLKPYMDDIRIIGERTVGKTVGSNTFGENEDYDWLLHPITLRIYNSQDEADYKNGFSPNVEVKELQSVRQLYPFGDTRDMLLEQAVKEIGIPLRSADANYHTGNLKPLSNSLSQRAGGLVVD